MSAYPLFPFGFGLNYTSFEYSELRLYVNRMAPDPVVKLEFKLKNTGTFPGEGDRTGLFIRYGQQRGSTHEKIMRFSKD